jgi:hypothetical protein
MAIHCHHYFVTDKHVGDYLDTIAMPINKAGVSDVIKALHEGHTLCVSCPLRNLAGSIKRQTIEKAGVSIDLDSRDYRRMVA